MPAEGAELSLGPLVRINPRRSRSGTRRKHPRRPSPGRSPRRAWAWSDSGTVDRCGPAPLRRSLDVRHSPGRSPGRSPLGPATAVTSHWPR